MISVSPAELVTLAIQGFGAMQKAPELLGLVSLLVDKNPRVLEIGVGKGGTSWLWSKFCKSLVAIDLPGGPWGGGPTTESLEYIAKNSSAPFLFIPGNSQSEDVFQKAAENGPYDFLFIDGDHSYEGVKADYERYSPLVAGDGIIAFHDICKHETSTGCEVERFWSEVKEKALSAQRLSMATRLMSGKIGADQVDEYGPHTAEPSKAIEFISEPSVWGGIGVLFT